MSAKGKKAPQRLSLESTETEGSAYYVFNNASGNGYAIVAGDDRMGDVIGYSTEGSLTTENMPEALRAILSEYTNAVNFIQQNNLNVKKAPRKANREAIAPFVKFQWNQSAPYNNMIPVGSDGEHCSTGCMTVSLATILAYYKYPETLPACYGYSSSDHSEAYAYKYEDFLSTYSSYSTPGEMPQFMYHVANLLGTHFDASGSGAQLSKMVPTLKTLGYNKNLRAVRRDAYSAEDWDEIIYTELANGRPVDFMGEHTDLGGHSYLCDGYKDGMYHILWGWGTTCVGYFDLNILNPFIEYISYWGQMGYNCPPAGFTGGLQAVIGIQTTDSEDVSALLLTTDDIAKNGEYSYRAAMFNLNEETFRGQLSWAKLETDGTFSLVEGVTPQTVNIISKGYTYTELNVAQLTLNDGDYKFVPVCKTNDEGAEWNLCEGYRQKYVEVTVNGEEETAVAHPVKNIELEALVYKAATGDYLEMILELKNNGDDAYGYLNITGVRDDGTKVNGSKMDIAVKAGEKQLLSVFLEHGGSYSGHTYDVTVEYLKNKLGSVTVDPSVSSSNYSEYAGVNFEDYEYIDGAAYLYSTTLKGELNISNSSSYYAFNMPIRITLKDESDNIIYQKTQQHVIAKGETYGYPVEITGLKSNKVYKLTAECLSITRNNSTYKESAEAYFTDFAINVKVGIPYYTATGTLERLMPEGTDPVDLPEMTTAIDFRKFDASLVNLSSIKNENCLYIFAEGADVPTELEGKNVIVGGQAEKLTLSDNSPAVFPIEFTAQEASYARTFTNYNNGGTGGWNTIVLPFEAKATLNGEVIDWFHSASEYGRKFWLYKYTNGIGGTIYFDYETNNTMTANEPYLLAVPGDKWGETYDLHNKEFIFKGENVTIQTNTTAQKAGGEYIYKGSYTNTSCTNGYKLNEAGDFFELQTETATELPFRAYFSLAEENTSSAAKALRIVRNNTNGIEAIDNTSISTDNQPIYNLNGQRIKSLQRGVNIINGKKIIIK